jgi:hypothetical protein
MKEMVFLSAKPAEHIRGDDRSPYDAVLVRSAAVEYMSGGKDCAAG